MSHYKHTTPVNANTPFLCDRACACPTNLYNTLVTPNITSCPNHQNFPNYLNSATGMDVGAFFDTLSDPIMQADTTATCIAVNSYYDNACHCRMTRECGNRDCDRKSHHAADAVL